MIPPRDGQDPDNAIMLSLFLAPLLAVSSGLLNDAPLLAVSSGLLSPSLLSLYLSLSSPPLPPQLLLLLLLLLLLRHHRHRTPSFPSYSSVAPALGAGASFSMLLLPPTPSPGF